MAPRHDGTQRASVNLVRSVDSFTSGRRLSGTSMGRRVTTVELLQFSGFNDLADVCRTSMRRRKTDVGISTIRDGRTRPIDVGVLAGCGTFPQSGYPATLCDRSAQGSKS